jgi:nucleotide-binding universal stress UspA family protein
MLTPGTILHPTDFSANSGYAFEIAIALARACGSRLAVLHVKETGGPRDGRALEPAIIANAQETLLEQLIAQRPPADVVYSHHLVQGDPAAEIVRMARKLKIDLIVMGSSSRSNRQRPPLGSVAAEIVSTAHCPVLTVRNGTVKGPAAAPRIVPARQWQSGKR